MGHFTSVFAASILALSFNTCTYVLACPRLNLTYERCKRSTDCANVFETTCSAVNKAGNLIDCPPEDDDHLKKKCRCIPFENHYCNKNDDCLDHEYCARSTLSGGRICVGCLNARERPLVFIPVEKEVLKERCTPPHAQCGHTADFCSPTMPCETGFACLSSSSNFTGPCRWYHVGCKCYSTGLALGGPVLKGCSEDAHCTHRRETCAWNTKTNKNVCVSCDTARQSYHLVLNDTSHCDQFGWLRKPPANYVEGPNGRTYDFCSEDSHCTGDRKCKQSKRLRNFRNLDPCDRELNSLCFCAPDKLARCQSARDCERGESCVYSKEYNLFENCASNAQVDFFSSDKYTLTGKNWRTGTGNGTNGEPCMFDWDCASPRRCTHVLDSFGGCAGRQPCECKPLVTPPCSKHFHCDRNEWCAKTIDAFGDPHCISKEKVKMHEYLLPFSDPGLKPASPTPIPPEDSNGLTEDPCLEDSDCVSPRRCIHRSQSFSGSSCDGTRRFCRCYPPSRFDAACFKSFDCSRGELCAAYKDSVPEGRQCMSILAYDTANDSTMEEFGVRRAFPTGLSPSMEAENPGGPDFELTVENICIDASLLSGMTLDELVFASHRRASVLCDESGSCATPGHLVIWNGAPMLMKSYCVLHSRCVMRTAWVNSPRMSVSLRIPSLTKGLSMTPLAARYESLFEEIVLKQLIRIGL